MPEALFYHLKSQPLERAIPALIDKCLERNWRLVIQFGTKERRDAMNTHLWTYKDESFIPHGVEEDGFCEQQAVYLTCTDENPNKAKVRFLVDRADSEQTDFQNYDRVVIMFSDDDKEAVNQARKCWKRLDNSDIELGYWQQNSNGGWEKKK